jgi:L-aminopeptidase/D-esterase-like protein
MKGLTDIPGIRVGHASNREGLTGCTAILCEAGAVAGVDLRGSASGTQELDLLNPLHLTPAIHGVCFAGGSAFGLEATSGVRRWLAAKGVGFDTGHARVPLVVGAILYDLGLAKRDVWPGREMGAAAAEAATDGPVQEGCVGAGVGATVGKVHGMKHAMKSGVGSFSAAVGPAKVAALAVVNAYGDVVHPRTRTIIAGTRKTPDSREFANSAESIKQGARGGFPGANTTLVVVATNVRLSKTQSTKLAQLAQHGLVQAISPVHTVNDGDLVIALSCGTLEADFTSLGIVAAEVVAESITRAAHLSWTVGGVPGLAASPSK